MKSSTKHTLTITLSENPWLKNTNLIIKGEPCDVDGAGGLEDARRNIGAEPCTGHHHIGLVGWVKWLRCWVVHQDVRCPDGGWGHSNVLKWNRRNWNCRKLHKMPLDIYSQTIIFIFYLFSHLHIFILWFIPPQVVIGPLLQQCAISDNFKFKMAKKSENERWNFTFCRSNINFYLFVLG